VLGDLPVHDDDRVLIDYRTSDDAGVFRLDDHRALVQTVDFFTPIVDDPFVYGQIAAANALSDVYAMGGRPLTALAIAAFPKDLDPSIVSLVFAGGLDKLREAGVALLGGHTVQDTEIKFGYAVTGEVNPGRVLANGGARPGDALLLTKPIGTGIIATALKNDRAPAAALAAAVGSMIRLNRQAADVAVRHGAAVHACTDVTGFGLLGHAAEMAASSRCSLQIDAARVPLLAGARALAPGNVPGGGRTNREHFGVRVKVAASIEGDLMDVLYDPQTSGGLLLAVDPGRIDEVLKDMAAEGVDAVRIGEVVAQAEAAILVI
jgi:selenide, water dikinase